MNKLTTIGECEVCDKPNMEVFKTKGNINMCAECKADDDKIVLQSKSVNAIMDDVAKVDTSIQVKQDIFNAATVPAISVKAAIDNDDTIPADQKEYRFTQYCHEQYMKFAAVAFDKHAEYVAAENEKRAWQVQTQTSAGKLRAEYREHFKNLNINYTPATVKTVKPSVRKPKQKSSVKEIKEASRKYGVDYSAVTMMVLKRNLDADTAAKELATLLGKL